MSKFGTKKKSKHWAERAREVSICRDDENHFNVTIEGGADNAEFLYMGEMRHDRVLYKGTGSKLHPDDIILEVNGKRVSGLIRKDVISLIKRSADPLRLRVTKPGMWIERCNRCRFVLVRSLERRFLATSVACFSPWELPCVPVTSGAVPTCCVWCVLLGAFGQRRDVVALISRTHFAAYSRPLHSLLCSSTPACKFVLSRCLSVVFCDFVALLY